MGVEPTLPAWNAAPGCRTATSSTSLTTTTSGASPSATTERSTSSKARRPASHWSTILRKREGYRRAFAGFDPEAVARFDRARIEELLQDAGIVRNRLKVESAVENAGRVLEVQEELGSFSVLLWDFVDGEPLSSGWKSLSELPAETPISKAMSKELKRRGFRFVGPTVCYAFMQAAGLVNDHVVSCFRYRELTAAG